MKKVLLVEDDERLAQHMAKLLLQEGIASVIIGTAVDLDGSLNSKELPSVIILDRLLGTFDTKLSLPAIKRRWPEVPILVVSAINTPVERAELLNMGADDYMGKPFLSQELVARIRALSRRFSAGTEAYRKIGNVILNMNKRTLSVGDQVEQLPAKEFLVLKTLSDDIGRVSSRNELLDSIWGSSLFADTNVVESTMTNLRKRLDALNSSIKIKNMRNAGYWIES
jgi:DNA-binding response OmpR family regulator